jgi:outer membrane lipoprotein-sorting protein
VRLSIPSKLDYDQASLMEEYVRRRRSAPSERPLGLDVALAEFVEKLLAPEPEPGFVQRLGLRLADESRAMAAPTDPAGLSQGCAERSAPWRTARPRIGVRATGVAGALVIIAMVGVLMLASLTGPTATVSAAEVFGRASLAATANSGNDAFEMVSRLSIGRAGSPSAPVLEIRRQVDGPTRWRSEARDLANDASGSPAVGQQTWLTVSDGATIWSYLASSGETRVAPYSADQSVANTSMSLGNVDLFAGAGSLAGALQLASECYTPAHAGDDVIVGRPTYVIDLGENRCRASGTNDTDRLVVPSLLWVDKESFAVLKWTHQDDDGLTVINEVVALDLDPVFDPSVFAWDGR